MNDFLKEMFINEAKPALERHSSGGTRVKKLKFTKDYVINIDGNEVTTYAYQSNEEELQLLESFIVNGKHINEFSGTISVTRGNIIRFSGSLAAYHSYLSGIRSLDSVAYFITGGIYGKLDITADCKIYLSEVRIPTDTAEDPFAMSDNLIANFVSNITDVYIAIPIE